MSKLKVKFDKSKKMHTIFYGKLKDMDSYRKRIAIELGSKFTMVLSIDTSLGKVPLHNEDAYDLTDESHRRDMEETLKKYEIPYELKKRKREVPLTIMGIATKNVQMVDDYYLIAYIKKEQMNEEVVTKFLFHHDYILALFNDDKGEEEVFRLFREEEINRANDISFAFAYIIDSQVFSHYYSNIKDSILNEVFLRID